MNRLVIDVGVATRNGLRLDTGSAAVMERLSAEDTAYYGALLAVAEVVGNPDDDEPEKTVLAGIASAYKPEELTDKLVVVLANLKPRKMRFGVSEGMILAAGEGGKDIFMLTADSGAKPGQTIH